MTFPVMTWEDYVEASAAEMNEYVRDTINFLKSSIELDEPVELTIQDGTMALSQSFHTIDTEGDAATDDLDTISGVTAGRILIVQAEHTDRTVVLRNGTGNMILGADISLDDTYKKVLLIGDDDGNLHLPFSARDLRFVVNAFQYPDPGTDWTPDLSGATLGASLSTKKCWLPLNFLKVGDAIRNYRVMGDAVEADSITLDCKLVRVNLGDPVTTTDIAGGGITQITVDGDFDVLATLTSPEVVAAQKQYVLEIEGTTGTGDSLIVMGVDTKIRRLT